MTHHRDTHGAARRGQPLTRYPTEAVRVADLAPGDLIAWGGECWQVLALRGHYSGLMLLTAYPLTDGARFQSTVYVRPEVIQQRITIR